MSNLINKLESKQNLSFDESKNLFNEIMEGKYNEDNIIKILEALSVKGETKDELAGGIFVLRDKATHVNSPDGTIDTCGTGGDGQNSLNISTASAIVLASLGIKVAKHGNKAVSSNCGSADVLEALKIKINLIGPLSNPAKVKRQVVGVFDKKWMIPFAEALKENNVKKAFIVHGEDGMDEISPFVKSKIIELNDTKIREFEINPVELGILKKNKENLKGKNAEFNASKIIDIFKGEDNEFSDAVALNCAAGLIVADKEKNIKESFLKVKQHLKSGKTYEHLLKIQAI